MPKTPKTAPGRGRRRQHLAPADGMNLAELAKRAASGDSSAELALVRAYQQRVPRSGDTLIRINAGLIFEWAQRSAAMSGVEIEDLLQEARLGFLRAVDKFDPKHGVRLATYAQHWARHQTRRYAANTRYAVRIPVWIQERRGEREGDPLVERAEGLKRMPSLQDPISDDGTTLESVIADQGAGPEIQVVLDELTERNHQAIYRALAKLSPRQAEVMRRRCGIGVKREETLAEIGVVLNLSRERVRQIEKQAKQRLAILLRGQVEV